MQSLVNQSIGEYRVVEFLGAGGMGEVYRAVHTRLARVVAIKILNQSSDSVAQVQRFYNEATVQASLRHPAVAEYYGFLELAGRPCILMEYVDGDTLHELLQRNGAFACPEAMRLFLEITCAVAHIHDQGVIHRDLKSSNIKVNSAGIVKLLDFGIARGPRSARLTKTGAVIGTLENLSPEQIDGGEADARTDIWALGVLLYEMLTGHLPFEASETAELYRQIRGARWMPPSKLGFAVEREVEAILLGCLRRNPNRRFQTARDLKAAILAREGASAMAARARPAGRPERPLLWLAGTAILLIGALVAWRVSSSPELNTVTVQQGGSSVQRPVNLSDHNGVEIKTVTIDAIGGPAQVEGSAGLLGMTPLAVHGRVGERFSFVLRRQGYEELHVDFQVSERHSYEYTLQRKR